MKQLLVATILSLMAINAQASLKNEILYFVMLDRFVDGDQTNNLDVNVAHDLTFHGGDLKGLGEQLDYIHELGATAVWLTPINRQIDGFVDNEYGEFYAHHGYWAEDLYSIDPRFGSEADLKALVDKAHRLDMKVILDVVYNHLGYGADFVEANPHWFRVGDQCGGDAITTCLSGLPDMKTELPEVREYLFDAHLGLAKRTGLDGFRLDTVKHIGHEFWQEHAIKAKARLGDDFILIGEIWGADKISARKYFEQEELDGVFDFVFRDRTIGFLNGIGSAKRYGRYLSKRHLVKDGHFLAPFLSNHDMPTLLAMLGGDKERYLIAATVLFSMEGMPTITWGEEYARQGKAWPKNRDNMYWENSELLPGASWDADLAVRDKFKQLIALRKSNQDLTSSVNELVYSTKHSVALKRGDNTLLVVNRSEAAVGWPTELGDADSWEVQYSSSISKVDLSQLAGAREARIYFQKD